MGKGGPLSFSRKFSRRRLKTMAEMQPLVDSVNAGSSNPVVHSSTSTTTTKAKKKATGSRLWMRFNRFGHSELLECEKSTIIKLASIPARDLRILGPVFSHSSNILAREKAMVVNLEFIKAIVTAEEVLLLDPLCQEVLPFVDQLRQQLSQKTQLESQEEGPGHCSTAQLEAADGLQCELPFEFQVLEIALEVVCAFLDSSAVDLERDAYPILDNLARDVSTQNLELVRSLKSNLTRLLARVQKVRDEIEHLLDDNEDMAQLYLTRKWTQNQQYEALLMGPTASNGVADVASSLQRLNSNMSSSLVTSIHSDDNDVEDLEMLLEAYFMQLDGTRNKILSVREYVDDTEDFVNIQLDNQRNELIQLQLTLTIASFAVAAETLITGVFGMNFPCIIYEYTEDLFVPFVAVTLGISFLIFFLLLGYARWKKLLGS